MVGKFAIARLPTGQRYSRQFAHATELRVLAVHAAPALLPHALADGAGDAGSIGAGRDDARLREPAGDFEHQLGTDRVAEFLPLPDRDHEGAGAADHAILVVDIEIGNIQGGRVGTLEHDRQAVDGDALGNYL